MKRAKTYTGIAGPCVDSNGAPVPVNEFGFGGFLRRDAGDLPGAVVRFSFRIRDCPGLTSEARFRDDMRLFGYSLLGELRLEADGSLIFHYLPPPRAASAEEFRGEVAGTLMDLEIEPDLQGDLRQTPSMPRGLDELFQ